MKNKREAPLSGYLQMGSKDCWTAYLQAIFS